MQQRTALIVAAAMTAFTLVVVGGVAARMTQATAPDIPTLATASSPTADRAAAEAAAQPTYLQQVNDYYQQREAAYQQQIAALQQHEAIYQQREAAYQDLVAQANEQLHLAYTRLAATHKKPKAPVVAAASQPTATATPYAISAESAAAIALAADPGTNLLATPELVSFEGTVAYEVRLERGNVYVDATTGQVLYNGAAAPPPQTSNAHHSQSQPPTTTHSGGDDGNHSEDNGGGEGGD